MSHRGMLKAHLATFAKQYIAIYALRFVWGLFILWQGLSGAALFSVVPNPFTFVLDLFFMPGYLLDLLLGRANIIWLVDALLEGAQLWVILKVLGALVSQLVPHLAAALPFGHSAGGTGDLDGLRLSRPWWALPVRMAFLTLFTTSIIIGVVGGAVQGQYAGEVIYYALSWPLWIAIALTAGGLLWGHRFNSSTRKVVAEHFGAPFLPDEHELTKRVHALSDRLSLPRPAVAYVSQANAFAVGSSPKDAAVVIGVPLLRGMKADELDAVIGHELGHIVSNDMRQMQFAVGYQRMFGDLFSFLAVIATQLATMLTKSRSSAALAQSLGDSVKGLGGAILFVGGELSCKGLSRRREYYADAVGAGLTSPDAMARALDKITAISTGRSPVENRYAYLMFEGGPRRFWPFDTHPSMEARKAALVAGTYVNGLPRKR